MATETENTETTEAPEAGQTTEQQQTEAAKKLDMTQDDLNNLIKKQTAKAQEKILKDLGAEDFDSVKDALQKLKEKQEAEMSEAEKWKKKYKEKEEAETRYKTEAETASARAEALSKGVPAEKAEKVVKLSSAYEGETMTEKIEAVLKDFPEFISKASAPNTTGTKTGGQKEPDQESELQRLRKIAGLT